MEASGSSSHTVLFLACHKKGTIITANTCRHLGHSVLFRACDVHSHTESLPLRGWSYGSPDSGEEEMRLKRVMGLAHLAELWQSRDTDSCTLTPKSTLLNHRAINIFQREQEKELESPKPFLLLWL